MSCCRSFKYFTQTQDDFNYRFADWSEWDDTYTFVKDANEDYIEENLTPEALTILDVNLVLFIQPLDGWSMAQVLT